MSNRIIIEADTPEMAYIIGLNIVDQLGIKPTALQLNNNAPIKWDTAQAIQFISELPDK